uniref:TlmJ n=1 Tax=Streptoalloteichus hindustanus TaxID=2017 RepID=A4KUD2_STRHI|nr:TlmJ [Streptoalloteichus hindustanus]
MGMINVFQPTLGEAELAAVREVFASGWLGRGPRTKVFEADFAEHLGVGAEQVVSVSCCTEGLFLSMELLGVGPGDEVVLPSISFVGAANAIAARGARPVFCDVDPATLNPTADHVAEKLGPRTKAVVVLHYGGYPGDLVAIAELCRERGVPLVEDSACAVASQVDGRACGTLGDVGVWSFDAMKILVTGDGGMLCFRDPELAERARKLASLGMAQSSGFANATADAEARWWEFEVTAFGRRSISNDVAASIGSVQLRRLPEFVRRRREIAERYDQGLSTVDGLRCPPPLPAGHTSSYYFYWVRMDASVRDAMARRLYDRGVYTTFRYAPLHLVSAYGHEGSLPGAERAAEETLCLPLHQALSDSDVETVIGEVRAGLAALTAPSGSSVPTVSSFPASRP